MRAGVRERGRLRRTVKVYAVDEANVVLVRKEQSCTGDRMRGKRMAVSCVMTAVLAASVASSGAAAQGVPRMQRVLVYTRNYTPDGKGYVHDNISASVEAIKKMGAESGFAVDASDDPAVLQMRV